MGVADAPFQSIAHRQSVAVHSLCRLFAMAQGGACLLSAVWIGASLALVGVCDILIGLGLLLGLRWAIRLAGSKVTATELKQKRCSDAEL